MTKGRISYESLQEQISKRKAQIKRLNEKIEAAQGNEEIKARLIYQKEVWEQSLEYLNNLALKN